MNTDERSASRPAVTISDLYADRDLTNAQVRRLVALLGLARPLRRSGQSSSREAA